MEDETANEEETIPVMAHVKLPITPNFLRYIGEGPKGHHISTFSDDVLRQVGRAWTERLIQKAHEMRHANERKNAR